MDRIADDTLARLTVAEYAKILADGTPSPGGGSASALAGALGCALAAMSARLTFGRRGYADRQDEMRLLAERADELRDRLLGLMSEDGAAYARVVAASRAPVDTELQRNTRSAGIQRALQDAIQAPLAIATACLEGLALARQAENRGNRNAKADAEMGVSLLGTALRGSVRNAQLNLQDLEPSSFRDQAELRTRRLLDSAAAILISTAEAHT